MSTIVRAQRTARLPVVVSREEFAALLARLDGTVWLMASLMHGAGLRLLECVRSISSGRASPAVDTPRAGTTAATLCRSTYRARHVVRCWT